MVLLELGFREKLQRAAESSKAKPYSKSRKMVPDQEMKVRSKWVNRWTDRQHSCSV